MSTSGVVGLLLAAVLCSGYGRTPCVETFVEFEKAVLNNSDNVQALVRAFYQPNLPIPLSVRVVYHVQSMPPALTGSALLNVVKWSRRTDIISTDRSCPAGNEIWMWVSSPVFIFVEPTKLNLCALYTLDFFQAWTLRDAHVYVPIICSPANRFNFLNELTSRVQIYAAAHLSANDANPGYVLKGCGDDVLKTLLPTTAQNNDQRLQILAKAVICIYLFGNFAVIFGGLLVMWVLVLKYRDILTRTNQIPSFDNYSLFWGCVALSVVVNGFLIAHTLHIVIVYVQAGEDLFTMGIAVALQLVLIVGASGVGALLLSRELSLDIPSILHCCCKKETLKKVVQWLALCSFIQCVLHLSCYVPFLVLALLASPATVLFALLIYITSAVCFVLILAVNFVFWKVTKTGQGVCCIKHCRQLFSPEFIQFVGYAMLCFASLCFIILISAVGSVANYGTTAWKNTLSVLSIVVTCMAPVPIGLGLQRIGNLWLQHHHNSTPRNVGAQVQQDAAEMEQNEGAQIAQDADDMGTNVDTADEENECTPLLHGRQQT